MFVSGGALIIIGALFWFFIQGHSYLGMALCFFGAVLIIYKSLFLLNKKYPKASKALITAFSLLLAVGFGWFSFLEAGIIKDAKGDLSETPSYIIVLGAGVNGSQPSLSLQDRLDAAYNYLVSHPDVKAVVSGGKGNGEDISEAECMRSYLLSAGISDSRIIFEDKAESTEENLIYSIKLISDDGGDTNSSIGILSSEYHLHRAKALARSLGINACGIPARTSMFTLKMSNFIREAFGMTHFYAFGN